MDRVPPESPRDPLDDYFPSITWVRKRDGSLERFDPGKLSSSIFAARQEVDPHHAAFAAGELSQAVLHFLVDEYGNDIPKTCDIAAIVFKVLREVGQGETARVYRECRERRARLRLEPAAADDETPTREAPAASTSIEHAVWDKHRAALALTEQGGIDAAIARETVAAVEQRLLRGHFESLSQAMIDELIRLELRDRGYRQAARHRTRLGVPIKEMERWLADPGPATYLALRAGRELWTQFSRCDVFSPEIVGLSDEGLLDLGDLSAPRHAAATALDTCAVAAGARHPEEWFERLAEAWSTACETVAGLIAVDALDAVLALMADGVPDPVAVAVRAASWLEDTARRPGPLCVVNLHGKVPEVVSRDLSAGPLFSTVADPRHHAWAKAFSCALLESARVRSFPPSRVRFDVHVGGHRHQSAADPNGLAWQAWIAPLEIRWVIDRGEAWAAEGLRRPAQHPMAVLQYVALDLATLTDRLDPPIEEARFLSRLDLLAEAAVRASLQKREFLRQWRPGNFRGWDTSDTVAVITPLGIVAAVERLLGRPFNQEAQPCVRRILARIRTHANRAAAPFRLRVELSGRPTPRRNAGGADPAPGGHPQTVLEPISDTRGGWMLPATPHVPGETVWLRLPEDVHRQPDGGEALLSHLVEATAIERVGFVTTGTLAS